MTALGLPLHAWRWRWRWPSCSSLPAAHLAAKSQAPCSSLPPLPAPQIGAAATFKYVFDYKPEDVYWCTADCGWITGALCLTVAGLARLGSAVVVGGPALLLP